MCLMWFKNLCACVVKKQNLMCPHVPHVVQKNPPLVPLVVQKN